MNCLLLYVFILFAISAFCIERKYSHTVDDDQYPIFAKLAKGSFVKPESSKKEKSVVVKFWRAKRKFEIKDGGLTYNGKKISLAIKSF